MAYAVWSQKLIYNYYKFRKMRQLLVHSRRLFLFFLTCYLFVTSYKGERLSLWRCILGNNVRASV